MEEAAKPTRRARVTDFVKNRPVSQRVGIAGAAALLATAPFSGLAQVAHQVDQVKVDKWQSVGPFDVSLIKVTTVSKLSDQIKPAQDGDRLLVVWAKVKNNTDEPQISKPFQDAIRVRGGGLTDNDGKPQRPPLHHVEDATVLDVFNPGLTYTVAIPFEQGPDWEPGKVSVSFQKVVQIEKDPMGLDDGHWLWLDQVATTTKLPVEVKP